MPIENTTSAASTVSWLPHLFSAAMIFFGWTVVYRNARRIASRNETFSLAGRVRDSVAAIEDAAADYYTDSTDSRMEPYLWEGRLLTKIDRIRADLEHLSKRNVKVYNLRLVNLRRTATLDADQIRKMTPTQKREKISAVKVAGTELLHELDTKFLQRNNFLSP